MQQSESTYFDIKTGAVPEFLNPKQYVDEKLQILQVDMYICPTSDEIDHLYTLKTQGDIDRAVHTIIERHWS